MRVVRDQIAAADLQRVHADLGGSEFHEPFGDGSRDRMTNGAVLTHHIFVLEYDAGTGAVIRSGVGAAGEVDDLVRFDATRARIDRVGADAGEVVDFPGGYRAVFLDADLRLHAMIAGVNVGDKALDAVGDE